MKNTLSTILNILSIASAVILAVLGGFCIYDVIYYSSSVYANSFDYWIAMRFYPSYLFAFSISGMVTTVASFVIAPETRSKTPKVVLFVIFVIALISAAVLQYKAYNF